MSPGMLDSAPIRALTLFSPGVPALAPLQTLARSLYTALQPHPVETTRLSLPSPSVFPTPSACLHFTQAQTPPSPPFTHLSLGTIHPHTPAPFRSLEFILSLLSSPTTFLSISLNHPDGSIHTPSVSLAAQLIHHLSRSGEPLSNLRFAALANMPPACPFLPASYAPIDPSLCIPSLGVSIAPLIPPTITDTRPILESLAQSLQQKCHPISPVALDFSLAPEIGGGVSSIDVLRRISGGELFQGGGWVAAAGLVAAQLASVKAERKVGFWGVMMPVLEDRQLANLSGIMPLLAVSAVCGTGLDVVPLPGDVSVEELEKIILDVAVMSVRLNGKPLTARLIPVPGKKEGEKTELQSAILVNGRVVAVGRGCGAWNGGDAVARIGPYCGIGENERFSSGDTSIYRKG